MRSVDFDFELPPELIAQTPAAERDASRLMVLRRQEGTVQVDVFPEIVEFFRAGDLLVVNDTRVIPARLLGVKESGGRVEALLVRRIPQEGEVWECLTRASKPLRPGSRLLFGGKLPATVLPGGEEPCRRLEFDCTGDFFALLDEVGRIPLPPYIRREAGPEDRKRYQTVFARQGTSVAAPTAGLHFTPRILDALREKGVAIHPVTLHVGPGTFLPVRVEDIRNHRMHGEPFAVSAETAAAVNRAREERRRVIAVGTTTIRTLESAAGPDGRLAPGTGVTDLFIYPGYRFKVADALVTNFHLPRSTLLMMVAAFAGQEFVLGAYRRAVREGFRFFSYGDCMLIL